MGWKQKNTTKTFVYIICFDSWIFTCHPFYLLQKCLWKNIKVGIWFYINRDPIVVTILVGLSPRILCYFSKHMLLLEIFTTDYLYKVL